MITPKPMSKEKVILFGASEAGRFFFAKYQDRYEVLAFADNEQKKQGQFFCDRPVIAPQAMANYVYDAVVVTSIFVFQIRKQLIQELGVPSEKIRFSPKEVIDGKSQRPFEDERTLTLAREMLLFLKAIFDQRGIGYFLDHGTLLGIVRGGDLLPWDDDIDLSILAHEREALIACLQDHFTRLPGQADCAWQLILGVQEWTEKAEQRPIFLTLCPGKHDKIRFFTIEISFNYIEADMAVQMINRAPAQFFLGFDLVTFQGQSLRAPANHESYLAHHYGDWRVPKKEISFYDIQNFTEPLAPTQRIRLL